MVGCWRINHAWGIREQGCRIFSEGPCRSEQAWRKKLVGMMLERSRQSHREGVDTAQGNRGFDSISPNHAGPGVTGKPGVDKKVGSAICRPLPVPASGISPPDFHRFGPSATLRTRRRPTIPGVEALPSVSGANPSSTPAFNHYNHPFSFRNSVERSILRTRAASLTDPFRWIVSRIIRFRFPSSGFLSLGPASGGFRTSWRNFSCRPGSPDPRRGHTVFA